MAIRTVSNTGGDWNVTTTWVGGVVPIAGDSVNFTSTSGNLNVNVSTASLIGIDFTNYTSTITFNNNINVNTTINLGTGGYTQAGAAGLNINGTSTLTSNGVTWSRTLTITTGTQTLNDNWTTTGSINFSGAITINSNTLNIGGNLTITTTSTIGGTTLININGTSNQTWNHTAAGYLGTSVTINKTSGTLTLGTNVYYNTGTLTHTLGDVDTTTNSNTFFSQSATINTPNITWNNFFYAPNASQTLTLSNNLYVSNTFTCGGNGTISGIYDIYCRDCNINNSSSGAASVTVTHSGIIYCSNNLTYSLATTCRNTGTVYVGGSVFFNAPSLNQGALNIYMVGNGTISSSSLSNTINSNLYFDTSGKITITTPLSFTLGTSKTINLVRGNVDASNCDLYFNQSFNHTLINMHKIVWRGIYLANGASLTMNEFFSGKPNLKTIVASSAGTNYTITFTDNFEKIAKFVTITNCTLSRPQQLLVITDSKKSSTNTRGMRYINNLPNGISKDNPSTSTQTTYSTNMLVGDPSMISNI